ncbi:uncharacterized protein BJX67DRAFT_369065 [Aspergillus lucknowensis]|uniref:P-loop containing nucleoside triphosphate hydrolase protein n=1 Tax=Aspergillus lucknowensis TaxID=176173 RepID=A0ABR4M6Z0_9EURO
MASEIRNEELEKNQNGSVDQVAADDSQASDNDGGERPVRNKLKETSITPVPKTTDNASTNAAPERDPNGARSRGRKRSHDDDQTENVEDEPGHRRKRSRDSSAEETKIDADEGQTQESGSTLKKKRSRDQLDKDDSKSEDEGEKADVKDTSEGSTFTEKPAGEGEPEKKRHRDGSQERGPSPLPSAFANTSSVSPFGSIAATASKPAENVKPTTSSSAFSSSSLAAFASSEQSPFGSLGGSSPSIFKSPTESTPAETQKPAGAGFAAASKPSSFAALGSGFSGFSGGFGGASSGGGLTSFASAAAPSTLGSTSSKPFGAEDDSEEEDDDKEDDGESGPAEFAEDKTDERFYERQIETGEEDEKTYFSCKAKLFHFSGGEWKERGLGTFKVNIRATDGVEDRKSARLIMRADGVLRVMLNTPVFRGMKVGDATGKEPKSKQIHLASLENGRTVPLLLRIRRRNYTRATDYSVFGYICHIARDLASRLPRNRLPLHPDLSPDFKFTTGVRQPWGTVQSSEQSTKRKRKRADTVTCMGNPVSELKNEESTEPITQVPSTTQNQCGKQTKTTKSTPKQQQQKKKRQGQRKPNSPWPDTFKQLSRTHRALNLVYTFCCTRKHFATTFDNIKKAVQAQTGGELAIEDIARVKVLIPRAIRLEYVDEAKLEVLSAGEREEVRGFGKGSGNGSWAEAEAGVEPVMHALLFEFLDGDLRREKKGDGNGGPSSGRKDKDEDLKMPVFSQKQMLSLIEKRNKKFSDAVDAFLVKCEDECVDPVGLLEREKDAYVPARPMLGPIPKDRKSMAEIIEEIRALDWYTGQIVPDGHRAFDAQHAIHGDLKFALSQDLVNALYNTKGITRFYSHQAEAINHLHDGQNSLIYQVPMLHELEQDPNSRGLYIFPTKALAQDQKRSMLELLQYLEGLQGTLVETFDGDTPMASRNLIREEARIIFTNPDMLHITILPQESSWRSFLQNLKFVVVDELHVYNGLFGSHVAFIMRRLRRICAAVGNRHVRFISCSATVANPEGHMRAIFGVDDVQLIDFDGSPCGRKEFLCWNTPFKDPRDPTSGRGDSLILRGARVIAFCRIRKLCEILLQAVRNECKRLERPEIGKLIMGYRGGYSPQDRRRIEAEMFQGQLLGIVATNALELGVDIGSLDAVITLGFPYSISNLRQQSGRAGRRNKDSLSILVGDRYPTDQYYMRNPEELFSKPNCELQVDLSNELVLEGHIQCAAFEMPIKPESDHIYFGPQLSEFAATRLTRDAMGFYHCHGRFRPQPSRCVPIRDTEDQHFAVIDITNARNIVLEEVEASRAFFTLYEGGIFLHQGQTFLVKELNPDRFFARRDFTDIDPIETEHMRLISHNTTDDDAAVAASNTSEDKDTNCRAFFGTVRIHAVVYGFFKIDKRGRILDAVAVDNPPIDIFTKGMWLDVPKRALEILESRHLNIAAAIHAAEHAVLSLLPSFVISSPGDVRTECKVAKKELGRGLRQVVHSRSRSQKKKQNSNLGEIDSDELELKIQQLRPPSRQRPARLTFYDAKGGSCGSGIARKAFEFVDSLLRRAVARIEACVCIAPKGCLECVCDERCKELNSVMSKAGAAVVLRCLLGWDVDVDSLPWGEVDVDGVDELGELVGGLETVVLAREVPWRHSEPE